jgi:hypothetical protein
MIDRPFDCGTFAPYILSVEQGQDRELTAAIFSGLHGVINGNQLRDVHRLTVSIICFVHSLD